VVRVFLSFEKVGTDNLKQHLLSHSGRHEGLISVATRADCLFQVCEELQAPQKPEACPISKDCACQVFASFKGCIGK